MNYDEFTADAKRLEEKRNGLRAHRSAPIVEAAINALFMRPVESYRRTSSTVGEVSANCQHADQRTTDVCAEVAQLREELAAAKEENELDREIAKLKGEARDLRERGAIKSSDPQAELLSSVTGGWLSPRDVGRALALLLGMTIEFVSAFGPTVLLSYAEATERRDATRRDEVPAEVSRSRYRLPLRAHRACGKHRDRSGKCSLFRLRNLVSRLWPGRIVGGRVCNRVRSAARRKWARQNPQTERELRRHSAGDLLMKRTRHGRCRGDAPCRGLSPPVATCPVRARPVEPSRDSDAVESKRGREASVSFSGVEWAAGNATEVRSA